jgi:PST family polysaccharide transporter
MHFSRILRSSAILGGAQVINLAAAFIRAKLVAQLLGPAGVGLSGLLGAFNGNVSIVASWGIGASGVRVIASASEKEKESRRAAVSLFGQRLAWIGGMAAIVLFWPACYATFSSAEYAPEFFIASLAIPCLIAGSTWNSILQAEGHINSLARTQAWTALICLSLGLSMINWLGTIGLAISIFITAAVPAAAAWFLVRKKCPLGTASQSEEGRRQLIALGAGLVIVGFASQASAYAVRLIIVNRHGVEGLGQGLADAGYYQAAFAITGSLPTIVLSVLGSDFFPRVASAKDEAEASLLTEYQIEASGLLALPIFTGLITLSSVGVRILYADTFEPAIPMLPWMVWGVFFRLVAAPMGYWLLARGRPMTVVIVEVSSSILMAVAPLFLMPAFGLIGVAMAFCIGNFAYASSLVITGRLRAGRWIKPQTFIWVLSGTAILAAAQVSSVFFPEQYFGIIPTCLVAAGCGLKYYMMLK